MQHVKDNNMKGFFFRRDRENKDKHDEILANDSINVFAAAAVAAVVVDDNDDDDDSNRKILRNKLNKYTYSIKTTIAKYLPTKSEPTTTNNAI